MGTSEWVDLEKSKTICLIRVIQTIFCELYLLIIQVTLTCPSPERGDIISMRRKPVLRNGADTPLVFDYLCYSGMSGRISGVVVSESISR